MGQLPTAGCRRFLRGVATISPHHSPPLPAAGMAPQLRFSSLATMPCGCAPLWHEMPGCDGRRGENAPSVASKLEQSGGLWGKVAAGNGAETKALRSGRRWRDVSRHLHAQARRQRAAHAARQVPRRAGRRVDGHQEPRSQPGRVPAGGVRRAGASGPSQASRSNPEARAFLRILAAGADEQHPDAQGRITLSADHRRYANLSKECVVIGSVDYLEIWDAAGMAGLPADPRRELLRSQR